MPATRSFTDEEWEALCAKTRTIVDHCTAQGIVLLHECDVDSPPTINDRTIRFNGDSREDDLGHETFIIYKEGVSQGFNFCKTACKPYDLACCLVLLAAHEVAPNALDIGSDGDWESDWESARQVYKELFGTEPCWVTEED